MAATNTATASHRRQTTIYDPDSPQKITNQTVQSTAEINADNTKHGKLTKRHGTDAPHRYSTE